MQEGCNRVLLPLYTDRHIQEAAARLFSNVEESAYESAMVRFLHRDNLLGAIVPELTERWTRNGSPDGSLLFTGPYGAARIASAGGPPHASFLEDAPPRSLNQALLIFLPTGAGLGRTLTPLALTATSGLAATAS